MILVDGRIKFVFRQLTDGEWQEQMYTRHNGEWMLRHVVWNMTDENANIVIEALKEIGFTAV